MTTPLKQCRCRLCKPVLDGMRADASPFRSTPAKLEDLASALSNRRMPEAEKPKTMLPVGSAARKDIPLARGVLDYFPAALAAVAELSRKGNEKHNPGEDLHWARGKSMDHADCIMRHLVERGSVDAEDGISHSVKLAWRSLALLQEELEAAGAPMARGAR